MKTVLYISYDGMTDPLGQSQVIPYLTGLAKRGHQITVLSCEKRHHFALLHERCEAVFADSGIAWHHVRYSKRPPVLSTYLDLARMRRLGKKLTTATPFDIVHCRTVLSALVGQPLARRQDARLIFDMRGFWADERVEGSLWSLSNPVYRRVYNYFKRKEHQFFREADLVITLTERAKEFIQSLSSGPEDSAEIAVVPCCADTDHFSPEAVDPEVVSRHREELGLANDTFVLAYLGSLGTRYMLGEMMRFFAVLRRQAEGARFLIVTRDDTSLIDSAASEAGVDPSAISIVSTTYEEIPNLIALADASVFFIKTGVSGKAVSPTKQAELLAMGVRVVCNAGIGDCDEILGGTGAGIIVDAMTEEAFLDAATRLRAPDGLSGDRIRQVEQRPSSKPQKKSKHE
ncbi:MAG: glycosyltransferase [Gemmatimonadetes bacterium]|nr:glycosyltransferase [Gemmatimonadota bacterium]